MLVFVHGLQFLPRSREQLDIDAPKQFPSESANTLEFQSHLNLKNEIPTEVPAFNRRTERARFFEKTVVFLRETETSDIAWKWVVIGLHGAMYGFAISACRGTDSGSVVQGEYLISFDQALKRCEAGRWGTPLVLSPKERESVSWLKKLLRNRFEHYRPCDWNIELHGFPTLTLNCVRIIETLATATSQWVHLEQTQRAHLKQLAEEARTLLLNSKLHNELQALSSSTQKR